jgi:hypothetical protein
MSNQTIIIINKINLIIPITLVKIIAFTKIKTNNNKTLNLILFIKNKPLSINTTNLKYLAKNYPL